MRSFPETRKFRIWLVCDAWLKPIATFYYPQKDKAVAFAKRVNAKDPKAGAYVKPHDLELEA